MIIYQISLPNKTKAGAFAKFMKEEYFPAIHKGPTRVGEVTSLLLQQSKDSDAEHAFLWQVGWSGLPDREVRVDDEKVQHKFESYHAKLKRIGTFNDVAKWPEEKA